MQNYWQNASLIRPNFEFQFPILFSTCTIPTTSPSSISAPNTPSSSSAACGSWDYFAKLYAIEDFPDIGKPGAIILSGGPKSTSEPDAPDLDFEALKAFDVPVLGVCYGMQLLNIKFGGSVEASDRREYGPANLVPGGMRRALRRGFRLARKSG